MMDKGEREDEVTDMNDVGLTVPAEVSFEEAIALTQGLLDGMEQGQVTEPEIENVVRELVRSENGARGFFVTYLSDDRSLADQPTPAVIQALQTVPDVVSSLLIKNLAMSTAMAMTHRRNQHEEMAQGSDRVRSRTLHVVQVLQLPELKEQAALLAATIQTGAGEFQPFLQRWQYDAEQQQAIYQTLEQTTLLS